MRLDKKFKKTGYFWLPSNPEKKITGTLVIKDGGRVELEAVGLFDDNIYGTNGFGNNLERIIGWIEKHGSVTLDDCLYRNRHIGHIGKCTIHVTRVFLGIAYGGNESILFNHFRFSVEGINEWVGRSGIKIKNQFENKPRSITYNPPKTVILNLNNGMKLQIMFSISETSLGPCLKEIKITQETYFNLSSDQECPVDDFIAAAHKITTLVSFAIDQTVCIEKVTASSEVTRQNTGGGETVPVSIYYPSTTFSKNRPKVHWHRMLFRFEQIQSDAERIVNNWFDAYDKIAPALSLYFSTKVGAYEYIDGKFLALAQALETYHRRTSSMKLMDEDAFEKLKSNLIEQCPKEHSEWLSNRIRHGNEVTLRCRIKSMIESHQGVFGKKKEWKKLITTIVDTRNYHTHYDQSLETRAVSGENLLDLCMKMEAIFQIHLLQTLGFTEAEVKIIFENSRELQDKLKEIQ